MPSVRSRWAQAPVRLESPGAWEAGAVGVFLRTLTQPRTSLQGPLCCPRSGDSSGRGPGLTHVDSGWGQPCHGLTQRRRARSRHTVRSARTPGSGPGAYLTTVMGLSPLLLHERLLSGQCNCLLADGGFRDTRDSVSLRRSKRVQGQAGPAPIPVDQEGILPWSAEAAGAQQHRGQREPREGREEPTTGWTLGD